MSEKLEPITPGRILLEEFLEPLGLSQNKLARELDVPAARINSVIKGTRRITIDMALRLGRFFKTGPDIWLNLQRRYDLKIAEHTIEPEINLRITPISEDLYKNLST
jgi:antitoxin HigA-1